MKRTLSLILMMLMVFMASVPVGIPVYAAEDTTPPVLKSIKVLTPTVEVGDSIKVQIEVEETETGLSQAHIQMNSGTGMGMNDRIISDEKVWSTPVYSTGSDYITYTFSIPTDSSTPSADWFIGYLDLWDAKGNYCYFSGNADNNIMRSEYLSPQITLEGTTHCTTTGGPEDVDAPVLNWVKFGSNTVEKPGDVTVSVNITETSAIAMCQIDLININDKTEFTVSGEGSSADTGTFTETYTVNFDSLKHNGKWTITHIYLTDAVGNKSCYTINNVDLGIVDYDNLVNIENSREVIPNDSVTVIGNEKDETKPLINSISVNKSHKTVKKPGRISFEMDITEEGSGVSYFEVEINCMSSATLDTNSREIYCFYTEEHGEPNIVWTNGRALPKQKLRAPLFTGKHRFTIPISSYVQNGEYSVYVREMTDGSENRYIDGNWEDPQCSDTFTVEDEFDYAFEMSITNPSLLTAVETMESGKTGRVLLDSKKSNNKVSKDVIDAIAGADKKIVFYRDDFQWIMDGKRFFHKQSKELDLNVKVSTIDEDKLSSNQKALCLTFSNNGVLPGKIQFRFKSSFVEKYQTNPDALHLYYVDEASNTEPNVEDDKAIDYANDKLDEIEEPNFDVVIDDQDAWGYVDIAHNSKYLVSGVKIDSFNKPAEEQVDTSDSNTNGETNNDSVDKPTEKQETVKATGSIREAKISGLKKTYTYTGEAIKPKLTVKLKNKKYKQGSDYTISYKNNKKIGTAKIIIKGKKFTGSKTLTFKIVPKGTSVGKLTRLKKGFVAKWRKQTTQTTGYQIQYSLNKKFNSSKTVTVGKNKTVSKTVKNLKANKKYYVRVRTYKIVKGKKYCSAWSKMKTVVTKK